MASTIACIVGARLLVRLLPVSYASLVHTFVRGITFAAILLLACAGLDGFGQSMTDTLIQERPFSITLPGSWTRKQSSDPNRWVYQSKDGRGQLTVSLPLGAIRRLSKEERSDTLKRIVALLRRAQTEVGATAITMTETTFGESGGVLAARFGGVEPAGKRRFAALSLCSPTELIYFYYEATSLTEAEFNANGRAIMNSIHLAK